MKLTKSTKTAATRAPSYLALLGTIVLGAVLLAACTGPSTTGTTPTSTSSAGSTSGTPAASSTAASVSTPTPTATSTSAAATAVPTQPVTPQTTATPTGSSTATTPSGTPPNGSAQTYLDNRSTAEDVIRSYYNAINSKQYARAYSYWEPGLSSSKLLPFQQFQKGYATTLSVSLTFGTVTGDVGAGQIYYAVPVELESKTSDNGVQTFVGCYTLHLGNPAIQADPPFQPMAIQSSKIEQVASIASVNDLLAKACSAFSGTSVGATPAAGPNDVSAGLYLDNRSDGADVIRSYYNAINRKEYARAYSYWEPNADASQLPAFSKFQQGYAQTKSVTLSVGTVQHDAGAGQRYASVPVTIVAKTTSGNTQTFVGCYTTHLASPDIQTTPPFQPMGIMRASVSQVDNGADTASLMAKACQP